MTDSLIARFFAALNAADASAAVAHCSDDVAHDWPEGGREIGRDSLRDRIVRLTAGQGFDAGDVEIMGNAGGTRAAAEFTWRDGQGGSRPAGAFFEIDDGRISRVTVYRGK